ncbi:hypothetical protein [Pseudoruegeria sp. HB172150]|uniref:hypothetical protein n=1 Tax=Pseudoruegeria sp. HB172150 TaxID=2721164 RepID=UPI0015550212|nr:hypothetical protein [Pseudoruegeria sp. HB172150]
MAEGANISNYLLAGGTLIAALFVAVQAWYARVAYVEASETRFLEKKLDICLQNFDEAARLDVALRLAVPGMADQEAWPPKIIVEDGARLAVLQRDVVPPLNALEAGLTKASVLGQLDKYRAYLAQRLEGLSKRLMDMTPTVVAAGSEETKGAFAALSDFLGAQYSVFTGCRLVAEGKA